MDTKKLQEKKLNQDSLQFYEGQLDDNEFKLSIGLKQISFPAMQLESLRLMCMKKCKVVFR